MSKNELKELDKAFDDKQLLLFYIAWLKNGLNATKAYQQLHPLVTTESAGVLGTRWLARVKHDMILAAYGLDIQKYMQQLKEGMAATRPIPVSVYVHEDGSITKREDGAIEAADHYARRFYHDKLGRILGLESKAAVKVSLQSNNYFDVNNDQVTGLTNKTGSMELGEEALIGALIEGDLPREESETSVGVHSQEFSGSDSAEADMSES